MLEDDDDFSESSDAPELIEVPYDNNKKIPITILSGYLGSGKTTLLNHILKANHGYKIAVIENEFGDGLGIETMIAKSGISGSNISNFFELSNGCICCTVKDDLLITLEQLVLHKEKFDYIIIETTGLANPGPVISSLWTDQNLLCNLYLDSVVCMIDSFHFEKYLQSNDISDEICAQVCFADRILLNKCDLVTEEKLLQVKALVQNINSYAKIESSIYSNINLEFILNINSYQNQYDMNKNTIKDDTYQVEDFISCVLCELTSIDNNNINNNNNNELITNSNNNEDYNTTNMKSLFSKYLNTLNQDNITSHTSNMRTHSLKIQGIFDLKLLEACLDSMLYNVSYNTNSNIQHYTSNNSNNNNSNNKNSNSDNVNNININYTNSNNNNASSDNNNELINTMKIFRMKGIVFINESKYLHIMQSVHDIFEINISSYHIGCEDDITNGNNLFVIIGKNLDIIKIEYLLTKCLVNNTMTI